MKKLVILFSILLSIQLFAQVPDPPFNPMTAPGASGISTLIHTLYWQNPEGVTYNEVYFSDDSALVENSDTSVRVINGYPINVYSSYNLSESGPLNSHTKYFWKVVEYNAQGSSSSSLWHFYTYGISYTEYQYNFDANFDGWQILGPQGLNNWYWSNTTHAGSNPGEAVFRWDPVFTGESYLISPEMDVPPYSALELHFKYYEDWWSDIVVVGCAYTTDNGNNWISIWDLHATGNVGPTDILVTFSISTNFRLGFYYTGNSNNIDFFYVDDVIVTPLIVLTPPTQPQLLTSLASETEQKVSLNWTQGWAVSGLVGYDVQRKNGLPASDSLYSTIVTTDLSTLSYEDLDVELNQSYTYRVRTLAMGSSSQFGNEATAYVPAIVPVELLSFSSSVVDDDVTLNWMTATETNNSGFQIERRETKNERSEDWENIGFVNGNGTTTEIKSYSLKDENLSAGKYEYRLKQIDFNGTFEYSNIVEAEIFPPAKFSLEQNFPNPFNPSTIISWQSPVNSLQTLKIYDVLGNEVATLVNEYRTAGKYEAEFNASNLASGIYYYKIVTGDFVHTRKMILLK